MHTVLMVDDELDFMEATKGFFALHGYTVIISTPGLDIRSLVLLHQPDIIVLDYLMGPVNGGELCSGLKKDKLTWSIPVIILTAYDRVIRSLGSYGCDLSLSKPIDLNLLMGQMDQLLHARSDRFDAC